MKLFVDQHWIATVLLESQWLHRVLLRSNVGFENDFGLFILISNKAIKHQGSSHVFPMALRFLEFLYGSNQNEFFLPIAICYRC